MSTTTFRIGDKVTPDAANELVPATTIGRIFTVAKVNPKNLKCTADDGGQGINFPKELLLPATDDNVAQRPALLGKPYVPVEHFSMGAIVTLKRPMSGTTADTAYVVCGQTANKLRIALLGGDGDRYVRVAPAGVVRRDTEWLAEMLLSQVTA